MLKRDGLALEETQVKSARRLFNLAALAVVAAGAESFNSPTPGTRAPGAQPT